MSDRAPYSRVYWSIIDDPKFATVFDSDANLAAWLRLLLIADQAYPASAHLPSNCRKSAITELANVGLIDLLPGHRYRLHGLDTERSRRSDAGRNAAAVRWQSERNAGASDDNMPSRAEQSRDETRQAEQDARDPADAYWQLTGRYPTDKLITWIDDLIAKFGAEAVIRSMVDEFRADAKTSTLMGRVAERCRREARQLDRREREAEQARLAEKRSRPRVLEPWQEDFRLAIEEQYRGDAA